MLAFAGNSLLCRAALQGGAIDPGSFTTLRLASGTAVLLLILSLGSEKARPRHRGTWQASAALFCYAATFSFAYLFLDAGTGALILFGFVQATMILRALHDGERPGVAEWIGWLLAAAGLLVLLLPGAGAPQPAGALLMAAAGVAWGAYSLLGRRQPDPLAATAGNFTRALVFVPLLALSGVNDLYLSPTGVALAVASGAVTSGLGYVLWYRALRLLTSMQAALVQLSVPAIAAAGGVLFLLEPLTWRLVTSGALVLGGISLALAWKSRAAR